MFGHYAYYEFYYDAAAESNGEAADAHEGETLEDKKPVESEAVQEVGGFIGNHKDASPIKITFFGSDSIANRHHPDQSWPALVTDQLSSLLPDGHLEETIIEIGRMHSLDFYHDGTTIQQIIDSEPDILLYEPLLLNDIGHVRPIDSIDILGLTLDRLSRELPHTDIIIVPANPLYNSAFYLNQMEDLGAFVRENNLHYADHWESWPAYTDESLNNFLENGRPNSQGHAIWADFIVDYLIHE